MLLADVNYEEEFVPADHGSYTGARRWDPVRRHPVLASQARSCSPLRNENTLHRKKKVLFRHKPKSVYANKCSGSIKTCNCIIRRGVMD